MLSFIATVVYIHWITQNWPVLLIVFLVIFGLIIHHKNKRREYLALPVYFIGNKATKIYHKPDCPHLQKTVLANRIAFRLPAETARLGYRPCGDCKPRWPSSP